MRERIETKEVSSSANVTISNWQKFTYNTVNKSKKCNKKQEKDKRGTAS